MAKIFKVSGYFVDANGVVDKEKFEGRLESLEDLFSQHLHIEEFDIGKWNDESPLNYDKCLYDKESSKAEQADSKILSGDYQTFYSVHE